MIEKNDAHALVDAANLLSIRLIIEDKPCCRDAVSKCMAMLLEHYLDRVPINVGIGIRRKDLGVVKHLLETQKYEIRDRRMYKKKIEDMEALRQEAYETYIKKKSERILEELDVMENE